MTARFSKRDTAFKKKEVNAERSGYPIGHGVLLHSQYGKTCNRTDR